MIALIQSYVEPGYQPIPVIRPSDEIYTQMLQAAAIGCADTVITNQKRRLFYLAKRNVKPMKGWFWIGGRIMAGELKEEAASRNFNRETGLKIPASRFKPVAVLDYLWKDRAQTPQEIGCHTIGYTHVLDQELDSDEIKIASKNLIKSEYENEAGLSAFDRGRLVQENVFPAILDLYDHLFPSPKEVEHGILAVTDPRMDDERRTIYEFNFTDSGMNHFFIKQRPKGPLGQHFHREKDETFYFLQGGGTIYLVPVDFEGNPIGEMRIIKVGPRSVIKIPAFWAHRLDLELGTEFVGYSSKSFDINDMPSYIIAI